MKELNYTDQRVRWLFIAGIILLFIILFTSLVYPQKSVEHTINFLDDRFNNGFTLNLSNYSPEDFQFIHTTKKFRFLQQIIKK
jgi:hypothetical protein